MEKNSHFPEQSAFSNAVLPRLGKVCGWVRHHGPVTKHPKGTATSKYPGRPEEYSSQGHFEPPEEGKLHSVRYRDDFRKTGAATPRRGLGRGQSVAAVFACDRGSYDPQKSASADSKKGSQLRSKVTATPPTRGALKPATWGDYHIAAGFRPIDLGRSCAGAPPATFVANAAPLFPRQAG